MFKPHCSLKERLSLPDICKVAAIWSSIYMLRCASAQRRLLNYSISNSHCVLNSSQIQPRVSKASLFHSTHEPSCDPTEQPGHILKPLLPNSLRGISKVSNIVFHSLRGFLPPSPPLRWIILCITNLIFQLHIGHHIQSCFYNSELHGSSSFS